MMYPFDEGQEPDWDDAIMLMRHFSIILVFFLLLYFIGSLVSVFFSVDPE